MMITVYSSGSYLYIGSTLARAVQKCLCYVFQKGLLGLSLLYILMFIFTFNDINRDSISASKKTMNRLI